MLEKKWDLFGQNLPTYFEVQDELGRTSQVELEHILHGWMDDGGM